MTERDDHIAEARSLVDTLRGQGRPSCGCSLATRAADIIDALVKERYEQGSCWDEGMTLPVREGECAPMPPKCELPHGHGGAHRAGRHEWMRRDSYNSVVAERDELRERLAAAEEGLFRVVVAIGEDTDGARTARDYFGPLTVLVRDQPPITDPVGITLHLVAEHRREMEQEADTADARVAAAERERDELKRDMHARELHHFEEEQKSAELAAVIERALYMSDGQNMARVLEEAPADALREHDAALIESLADAVIILIQRQKDRTPWFWKPQWYWSGWKTLLPIMFSHDEKARRTLLVGWTVTGRVVFPLWGCGSGVCHWDAIRATQQEEK